MKTLNVIGAGRVGRTLAALWHRQKVFLVQDVLDGTPEGACSAVAFIGEGSATAALPAMRAAEVWMISTPDRRIAGSAQALASSGLLRAGDVVFHCSGSMASTDIASAAASGARIASVHPLKSFADPAAALLTFEGTHCVAEGHREGLDVLVPAFERIGGRVAEIDPKLKTIYHAASVIVCNYLTALLESGLECFEQAGLARETAMRMMEPLVRETLDNVIRLGPAAALTGPIARGDDTVVAKHLDVLDSWSPRIAAIYRDLGAVALDLSRSRGDSDPEARRRIEALLGSAARDAQS
ncbi:MAG TPA: Rossmann-like and DUF2520 domain-containing protein [Burkholderiales bacterium]|nr:Rossmann-like and DUF2520 domain-containing protein [Burkholderiales bacterium]